jgi:hypothetical protein
MEKEPVFPFGNIEGGDDKISKTEKKENIDLGDSAVVEEILCNGTKEELDSLAAFYNFSPEQIELFVNFEKLRKKVHAENDKEFEKRILEDPEPTEEEELAGVYCNEIEPQVRDAVFLMRKKGYNTYESGFYGLNKQKIGVTDNSFEKIELPLQILEKARKVEIEIEVNNNAIELICQKYIGLEEIKEIWDNIADFLPVREEKAKITETGMAKKFKERIENSKSILKDNKK